MASAEISSSTSRTPRWPSAGTFRRSYPTPRALAGYSGGG
jgi:hypothetical protein